MYDFNKVFGNTHPLTEIEEVYNSLKSITPIRNGKPGQKFYLDQNDKRVCFILYSGVCLIKRTVDSLVISTIKAPGIVGLQDLFHAKSDVGVFAVSNIEYGMIAIDELFSYVDQHGLWKKICYMLMLSSTRFIEYQKETVGVSNYELICNLLVSLSNESFEIRATTTAQEYISERSLLSRSGIMKTLSSLKSGGYIVIKKGLLIGINALPKKY